jgi:hypothetical protein
MTFGLINLILAFAAVTSQATHGLTFNENLEKKMVQVYCDGANKAVIGTAIVVGYRPGSGQLFLVTAKHVVPTCPKPDDGPRPIKLIFEGLGRLTKITPKVEDAPLNLDIQPLSVSSSAEFPFEIMEKNFVGESVWNLMGETPQPGEALRVLGYPGNAAKLQLDIGLRLSAADEDPAMGGLSYTGVTRDGMSGGAVVDSAGNLIGMHTSADSTRGLSIWTIKRFFESPSTNLKWSLVNSGAHAIGTHSISAVGDRSCRVSSDGAIYCWGGGIARQKKVKAPEGVGFTEVAVGRNHIVALDKSGKAWEWQKEVDEIDISLGEILSLAKDEFSSIGAGNAYSCGILKNKGHEGHVKCWGRDWSEYFVYVPYRDFETKQVFSSVSVGQFNTCGITANGGGIYCWGKIAAQPQRGPIRDFSWIAPNQSISPTDGICGVVDAKLYCWDLGESLEPGTKPLLDGVNSAAIVDTRVFAVMENGLLKEIVLKEPSRLINLAEQVVEVAVGEGHLCFRDTNSETWCAGDDSRGAVGQGGGDFVGKPLIIKPPIR